MASGIGAALGAYRAILLCMVIAVAYGLCAGWVQPLFTSAGTTWWPLRIAVLWSVATVAFWPTTNSCADKVAMSICMLIVSALTCFIVWLIIEKIAEFKELI